MKTNIQACVVIFTAACTFFLLPISVSAQRIVKCPPNNEPVSVPRHPERAYKEYATKTDVSLKATISVLDKIKLTDVDAGTKGKIVALRDTLNQFSIRNQDIIKASYMAYAMTPCDVEVRKRHFDLLSDLAKESGALEKLRVELDKLLKSGGAAGIDNEQVKSLINIYHANSAPQAFIKRKVAKKYKPAKKN